MNKDSDRIEVLVSEKRVKLHTFEPSGKKIWTVVGRGEEHWVDPMENYCSCPGFYFAKLNGKGACYHLESMNLARQENKTETIVFSDDEFPDFIKGLIDEL